MGEAGEMAVEIEASPSIVVYDGPVTILSGARKHVLITAATPELARLFAETCRDKR